MNKHSHPAALLRSEPRAATPGAGQGAAPATLPIGATCEPPPCGLQRAETSTGGAKAPNASTSIPRHMIATVRNNQLPTAELAARLGVSEAEIDAIRALGHYSGGELLEPSNGSTWLRAEQAALNL